MAGHTEALMASAAGEDVPAPMLKDGVTLPETIVLFISPGSQYCVKAAAYLLYHHVPFRYEVVENKQLAAPGLVPVLRWGDTLVPDSQRILEFVEQFLESRDPMYPGEDALELDGFIGTELNEHVQYMSFIDEDGFDQSLRAEVEAATPACLRAVFPCCCNARSVLKLSGYEKQIRERIARHMPEEVFAGGDQAVRKSLRSHMKDLNTRLSGEQFLLGTLEPTGCDYSLYGMLSRLIGDSGCGFGACYPNLLEEARCDNVQAFYDRMDRLCPVDFSTPRVPTDESVLPDRDAQLAMRVKPGDFGGAQLDDDDKSGTETGSVL